MDGRHSSANDLQMHCTVRAQQYPFAAKLNSQARQQAAYRAWVAISRFYANCKARVPGKKGYPRFQHDCRSVEYNVTGWKLDPDGKGNSSLSPMGMGLAACGWWGHAPARSTQSSTSSACGWCGTRMAILCAVLCAGGAEECPPPDRQADWG
jgi:hypothetical protein